MIRGKLTVIEANIRTVSDGVFKIRIDLKPKPITIFARYVLTSSSREDEIEAFHEDMEKAKIVRNYGAIKWYYETSRPRLEKEQKLMTWTFCNWCKKL